MFFYQEEKNNGDILSFLITLNKTYFLQHKKNGKVINLKLGPRRGGHNLVLASFFQYIF